MEEISRLSNGLTVITHTMPHLETTSLGIWVGVGSRSETLAENGISHFLEHMSFKGTASRTAQAIAEEIEAVGGELNAATGLETTAYFARVLKGDEGVALEILADILLNSRFSSDELEREREVILQEIAATRDVPDDIAFELMNEAAYPGQALGRTILGPAANVKRFSPADLQQFLKTHYRPGSMVLAAAGAVHHEPLVRHAEALFGGSLPMESRVRSRRATTVASVGITNVSSRAISCLRSKVLPIALRSISRPRFSRVSLAEGCRPACSRRLVRSGGFAIRSIRPRGVSPIRGFSRCTRRRERKRWRASST